jgi:hypothetical protein
VDALIRAKLNDANSRTKASALLECRRSEISKLHSSNALFPLLAGMQVAERLIKRLHFCDETSNFLE